MNEIKPIDEAKTFSVIGDFALLILVVAVIYYLHPILKPITRKIGERLEKR
ncbi:MAG: hypothetical protein QXO40_00240 [Candidatus Aenigmatarchaeota archaeon]